MAGHGPQRAGSLMKPLSSPILNSERAEASEHHKLTFKAAQ